MSLTLDRYRETAAERASFERVRRAETSYAVALRKIGRHVADIVRALHAEEEEIQGELQPGSPWLDRLMRTLYDYGEAIRPWARSTAARMLADVERRDTRAWENHSRFIGEGIRREIESAPTGIVMRQLLDAQVDLITSLPRDAARRVHAIATSQIYTGERPPVLADEIMKTGLVTIGRANLIARTETGRAATTLTQVRAQHIGSEGYIWRAIMDGRTRPALDLSPREFARLNTKARGSHRKLDGTFHRWDDPPISGPNGERSHPGCIYNCRCIAEPVLPSD